MVLEDARTNPLQPFDWNCFPIHVKNTVKGTTEVCEMCEAERALQRLLVCERYKGRPEPLGKVTVLFLH